MNENEFIAAARPGQNSFWRYVLTVLLVLFLVLAGGVCLTLPAVVAAGGSPDLAAVLPGPLYLALNLAPFAFIPLALLIGLRVLHRRPFMSLINPRLRFDWGRFGQGAGLWLALNVAYNLVFAVFKPGYYTYSFDPLAFLPFLVVSLLLIPVQSGAEELFFRGYLTQGFGLLRWWLGWIIPAVGFGLLHGANPEVGAYGLLMTMPVYVGMGLLFGWITLRTRSLEMALGVHILNNLYASLITTFPSSALQTQAVFTIQNYDATAELIAFFVLALIFVVVLEWILRRQSLAGRIPSAPLLALLAGGLLLGLSACAPANPPVADAPLPLSDCQLTVSGQRNGVAAQCGTLSVPENRDNPDGRQIKLNVAVLKAVSRNPAPDPLFLMAGGPGEAASESFAALAGALERVRFKRDLVLVDQRGTGKSAALDCLLPDPDANDLPDSTELPDSTGSSDPTGARDAVASAITPTPIGREPPREEQLAEVEDCLADLAEADLSQYTTDIAMHDLDEVRAALGYEQINLLGVSYGTRAALTYTRLFPERVRSLVLDGVVPPAWVLGASLRADAQRALDLTFERCLLDDACNQTYPDFENDFYDVLARLQDRTIEVETTHPTSGETVSVAITPLTLTTTTRLMSYSDLQLALLPLMIHNAYLEDYRLLASQYLLMLGSLSDSMSIGMYYSVWCNEDVPNLPEEGELGMYYFDPDLSLSLEVCQLWTAAREISAEPTAPGDPTLAPTATLAQGETAAPGDTTTETAPAAAPEDDYPPPGSDSAPTQTTESSGETPASDSETPASDSGTSTSDGETPPPTGDKPGAATPSARAPDGSAGGPEIDVARSFPRTDIPVLLISGEADPVTPPANGDQVAEIFTNSLHIVLPGMGHANFYAGCLPTLIRDFLEAGSPQALNPDCTQTIRPMPFFLSPLGPEP